jgi:hypothetical protein
MLMTSWAHCQSVHCNVTLAIASRWLIKILSECLFSYYLNCIAVLAVPPEILVLSRGSVAASRDREAHGVAHNLPSVVRVREGLTGRNILVSSRTSDSCVGPGAVHADQVARCTVFPPTHWCGWLPGWMCIVSRSSAAWLGCVSEDTWLSTFASTESVRELHRWDKTVTTNWIPRKKG